MKRTIAFTLDYDVLLRFNKETKARLINRSALLQALIEHWLSCVDQEPIITSIVSDPERD